MLDPHFGHRSIVKSLGFMSLVFDGFKVALISLDYPDELNCTCALGSEISTR